MRDLTKSPLKIGILGCGSFAERRILTAAKEVDTIQVIAIQRRHLEAAKKTATTFSIPNAYSSREELLQHPDLEAVIITSSNQAHEEDALACAKAKKPTLCEKPLAPTVQAAERMILTFEETSTPFLVGQSLRFKPCVQKAKEMLEQGLFGNLLNIRCRFSIQVPKENWRHSKESGGGALQDLGVHLIDLIHFVTGEKIELVSALANLSFSDSSLESDQTISALMRLSNGALASLECSFEQPYHSGFEVIGTKGQLVSLNSLRQGDSSETLTWIPESGVAKDLTPSQTNIYVEELRHFAEVIAHKKESIIPARIGLENQRIIERIYSSIKEGHNRFF